MNVASPFELQLRWPGAPRICIRDQSPGVRHAGGLRRFPVCQLPWAERGLQVEVFAVPVLSRLVGRGRPGGCVEWYRAFRQAYQRPVLRKRNPPTLWAATEVRKRDLNFHIKPKNKPMTMTKEYRAELRDLKAQEREISTGLKYVTKQATREISIIERNVMREGKLATKQLTRIAKRRAVLEGRLS